MEYGNRTIYRNTEIKTIYLYRFHSNPIRDIFGGKTRRKGMEWGKEFNGATRNFAI
ncbi:phosphoglycerate mutase [Clostridiaceae bacterium]|uniref:Phosphoglycerate mutase n=2 Tax=Eubacteriales TaxID=186802 RepID=A0A845QND0_9FIRM|nr:phosphoglycerate mutase [Hungateiclostridiaceae bacterium KB18]ASB40267.1 phosphoglycerate mutase [Acutalibacter muris]MBT9691261.1 phosphoglycerate mutase [Faecalibacterium prausnitzii]MBT9767612.1 phosphoglycerate mutase [Clostridium sp. MCC345]NBH36696.1 phosphoglycerate mutase [Clostridiaceae bacterium]NBH62914.1 phosphoglycerate mutase [Anaerotruncus colihominis]NCF03568.1 phosphoglycerate mutase [Anaerotruncus sp. 80]